MIVQDRRAGALKPLRYTFFSLPVVSSIFPESISTVVETNFNMSL